MYPGNRRLFIFIVMLALSTLSCSVIPGRLQPETPVPATTPTAAVTPTSRTITNPTKTAAVDDTRDRPLPTEVSPPPKSVEVNPIPSESPAWPPAAEPIDLLVEKSIGRAQFASFDILANAEPPERDDMEVARSYLGWNGLVETIDLSEQPLPVGTVQQLTVLNHDSNTLGTITAELMAVGENAYFWFDTGPGSVRPSTVELSRVSRTFDQIYQRSVAIFGQENKPGIDGDSRLHVVNASPLALCDVAGGENFEGLACRLAGYFSADDTLPANINPESNVREMFVMNGEFFGTDFYLNVLAHELRHMIEDNYDRGDADWEAEGSAMLAEDLLGFPDNGVSRANLFLAEPDQQLNSWPDDFTLPAYGQGYLFNRYIYDRLGQEVYRQIAASPATGLKAIELVAQSHGIDVTGLDLWKDWQTALALQNVDEVPLEYRFGVAGINQVNMTEVDQFPFIIEDSVHQFAADYYRLVGNQDVTIDFNGSALVPLLDTMPASGQSMWLANRANYSHMSLTREADLTGVGKATLNYHVYHDIETGYDFAYLFISENGGRSWHPVQAGNMQGMSADPASSALSEYFYTGKSDGWRQESVDLTPYAGQKIALRFVYITDLIKTYSGIAIDNISIPEIGFYDDAESLVDGWSAEGFERVTATIPQQWHLRIITFANGQPEIQTLELAADQTVSAPVSLGNSEGEAFLIIAAYAPMTLEKASYQLEIN